MELSGGSYLYTKGVNGMDVLKISETKIKITLLAADAKAFGLDGKTVDYNDMESRSKIWRVLDTVKMKWGFDPEGEKLLVQYYPSKDGGAEIFVTKLGRIAKREEHRLSSSEDVTVLEARGAVYCFSDIDDLISACRTAAARGYIKDSELYYTDGEGYFLSVSARGAFRHGELCEGAFFGEYSKKLPPDTLYYLREHSELILPKGAVELMAQL